MCLKSLGHSLTPELWLRAERLSLCRVAWRIRTARPSHARRPGGHLLPSRGGSGLAGKNFPPGPIPTTRRPAPAAPEGWASGCSAYLVVGAPRQLGLDDHDHDAEHAEDERVVAEPLALLEQGAPVAQLVADVLVLLFAGLGATAAAMPAAATAAAASSAAAAAGSVERQVIGVVVLRLRHHDLRG